MNIRVSHGFTLIELAVALIIVGVLAGTFISTLGARIDLTRHSEAVDEMNVVKQALYGYAMSNNFIYLPCPDCRNAACIKDPVNNFPNDGIEDRVGAVCDVDVASVLAIELPFGNLPWQTLGLASGDSWDNRYSYWVSSSVSDSTRGFMLNQPVPAVPAWNTVWNTATINTRIGVAVTPLSTSAVAIIMSHGKNSYGAISTQNTANSAVPIGNFDEIANVNDDLFFVSRTHTDQGASPIIGEFDDILVWISEYELKARMLQAGVLP